MQKGGLREEGAPRVATTAWAVRPGPRGCGRAQAAGGGGEACVTGGNELTASRGRHRPCSTATKVMPAAPCSSVNVA